MFNSLLALLFLTFTFVPTSDPVPALERQHAAAHHINFKNVVDADSCSATAVGPHTLLTAGHCLMATNEITIDGKVAHVASLVFDDADHMLVVADTTFSDWLRVNQTALATIEPGTPVHMWGNPGHRADVSRTGTFLKWDDPEDPEEPKLAIFDLPIYGGDSGSGILDQFGAVIAVVSLGDKSAETAVFPLQFTPEQLSQIR